MDATSIRLRICDYGWNPIPVERKRTFVPNWTRYCREAPSNDEIDLWGQLYPRAINTGIALGRQVVVDIDVASDPALAHRIRVLAVEQFGETPFVRVGRAPKLALIYRAAGTVATRRFKAASDNGDGIEILSDGAQVVAFGIHPDTGKPYEWTGPASPLDAGPEEAPQIAEADVEAFLDAVHAIMPLGASGKPTGQRPNGKSAAQAITRNEAGLVVDGRELFLAHCVWRAAGQLHCAGEELIEEAVTTLAWSFFSDPEHGADLKDQRWSERDAFNKARTTIRRLKDGKVKFRTRTIDPTYPDNGRPVEEARKEVEAEIRRHLDGGSGYHAIRAATGVGKTRLAAKAIAEEIKRRSADDDAKPFLYCVPTHRLGDEIEEQFEEYGISDRVFRGRNAEDPEQPGQAMCDDLPAVQIALDLGAPVACCKGKRNGQTVQCAYYETCSYQRQLKHKPDVWIVAHQLLFHAHEALGEIAGVFIDESFWRAGLWAANRGLTIDEIANPIPPTKPRLRDVVADLEPLRQRLACALRRQQALGGFERRHLVDEGLSADECTKALSLEWKLKGETPLWPGMPLEARKAAEGARHAKHVRSFTRVWGGARDLLDEDDGAVSGRLFLAEIQGEHGVSRAVRTRGVRSVAKKWAEAPTFIMDATLPETAILRIFYPLVEVVAKIDVTLPHVTVRQVLGAPVSAKKLGITGKPPLVEPAEGNRNIQAIRRAILQRHLELGRTPTLVIAQKAVATWLKASGLPPAIAVEHFNNISGLDDYRDVRLLITVGRTLPSVFEVEALAGALTGFDPVKTAQPPAGPRWFDRIMRGIRLRDGTGYAVEGDVHPDPMAEAIRWQICEGELVQAIGRARGVNRNTATPLTVDIMTDVVLPLIVAEVVEWSQVPAGAEVEMLAEGMWLDSPSDTAKCWPKVWATEAAAKQWRDRFTRSQIPIKNTLYRDLGPCGRYQLPGPRQKWRTFRYAPAVRADPRAWLEKRLGRLAGFEIDDIDNPVLDALDALFDAAALGRPEPPASRFTCSEPCHGEPAPPCHRGHLRLCGLEISP